MGLYNFQERFAPRIRQGDADPEHPDAKAHTIRAPRKRRRRKDGTLVSREDKPGSAMYLYTGLRHKGAARIIEPVVCARVESVAFLNLVIPRTHTKAPPDIYTEVFIGPFLSEVLDDTSKQAAVIRDPEQHGLVRLDAAEREQLARRDGFESFAEMMAFWDGKLPWYGHIFHWRKADAKPFSARRATRRFEMMVHDGARQEYGV